MAWRNIALELELKSPSDSYAYYSSHSIKFELEPYYISFTFDLWVFATENNDWEGKSHVVVSYSQEL